MTCRVHDCLECGAPANGRLAEFCSSACRHGFNNRRKQRGAELYDLYMAHRFERAEAQELGVFQAINRLAAIYRDEDKARRAGRRSWRKPKAVLLDRPYVKAIATWDGTGRGRAMR